MINPNFTIKLAGEDITTHCQSLNLHQSLSDHHEFVLHLTNEDRSAFFKGVLSESSQKWIGQPFEVEGLFKGVVTAVSLSRGYAGSSDFMIRGQSPTIYLDDGIHARSFGEKQLQQILDTVMQPYSSKFETVDIKAQYGKIKYCVQYRESNFNFINRLAARYGEWFFYDGLKLSFGKPVEEEVIRLNFPREVMSFNIAMKTVPVNFKLKMYDYKKHTFPQKQSEYTAPTNPYAKIAFDKSKTEIYPQTSEVPINIGMSEIDLEEVKTLRQNAQLNELVVLMGSSREKMLKLGCIIKITDEREDLITAGIDDYGEYIITHLTHEFSTHAENYSNYFEAIPKEAVIPPIGCSPDPPPCEIQEATIVENNDPDALGRVRVQFFWQKDASDEDAKTNWIRVAAHSGGGDKGLYVLPEIGDTVLVAFEHDHPERAYVLSSMYHAKAKPQHHDPGNMKKALKTKGGHQMLMDDTKGSETMAFFSPTDITAEAKAGKIDVTAQTTITVKSKSGDITITTPAKIDMNSTGDDISIKTPTNISIDASGNITIHAKGNIDITADGNMSLKAGGTMSLESGSTMSMQAGSSMSLQATSIGAKATAADIALDGATAIGLTSINIDIAAKAQLNASAAQVSVDGSATTSVSAGGALSLDAKGVTSVSGSILKLN